MAEEDEVSEGGSQIHRHEKRDREWTAPDPDTSVAEDVERHFESCGLSVANVLHELVSDYVHIDVHVCEPTDARPFYTLFTTGMGDLPMAAPESYEHLARAELMLCLPSSWPLGGDSFNNEEFYWPIGLMKFLARFPHEYETWLGEDHTIPNGDPPDPFDDSTGLCGTILARPATLAPEQHALTSRHGPVQIYAVVPLYEDEMNLKLKKGADALLKALRKKGVNEVIDPKRGSVARRLFRRG